MVKRKGGGLRFCVDYRKLTTAVVKDLYPLPRIAEALDKLSGSCYFSTLALTSGCWQVEINPSDRSTTTKTAFVTQHRLYQFNVMPFGLVNAPATFQRLMERVLAGLQLETCLVYLDDIIIFSKTFDNHLSKLQAVFQRLREANLHLKPQKCEFAKSEVSYLGYVVGTEGLRPEPQKVDSVLTTPIPTFT